MMKKMKKKKFEYGGKQYKMTEEQIEAAFRYQDRQYRLADASEHLYTEIYGDEDLWNMSDFQKANLEKMFERETGVSVERAKEMLDMFADAFEDNQDCNECENDTWHSAIAMCLERECAMSKVETKYFCRPY